MVFFSILDGVYKMIVLYVAYKKMIVPYCKPIRRLYCTVATYSNNRIRASKLIAAQSSVLNRNNSIYIVILSLRFQVAFLLLMIAFFLGYGATRIPGLSFSVVARRTVAIETALQNTGLATTIVLISFRYDCV